MTVEGQRYLEECRKVLKEEQMDAVSMGLDFGLPVSDIQKVVKRPCGYNWKSQRQKKKFRKMKKCVLI